MSIVRNFINAKQTLLERLYDSVDSYDVYNHFFREAKCIEEELVINQGILYLSPFRYDEKPTVSLFTSSKTRDILFTDFALGVTGDIIKFVNMYARHNGINLESLYDTVSFINSQMGLNLFSGTPTKIKIENRQIPIRQEVPLLFKSREFTINDLKYWAQFNVDENLLKEYDVRSIQYMLNENNEVTYEFSKNKLAFALVISDKVKIYCPESIDFKWRSNVPGNKWEYYQGVYNLKYKNTLLITKSCKDLLTFKALANGQEFDVIAPQSETVTLVPEFATYIKDRYDRIIVVMDYDAAGVKAANKLKKLYGFEPKFVSTERVNINGKLKCLYKDISDLTLLKGITTGKIRVKEIIS
jgi:hypothetical protein